jgi:hypothetical protein
MYSYIFIDHRYVDDNVPKDMFFDQNGFADIKYRKFKSTMGLLLSFMKADDAEWFAKNKKRPENYSSDEFTAWFEKINEIHQDVWAVFTVVYNRLGLPNESKRTSSHVTVSMIGDHLPLIKLKSQIDELVLELRGLSPPKKEDKQQKTLSSWLSPSNVTGKKRPACTTAEFS